MDVVLIFDETSVKLREISPAPGMKIRMDPSAGHVEACIAGYVTVSRTEPLVRPLAQCS